MKPRTRFCAIELRPYLLGLSGVVDKIRWIFDATPAGLQAPHGYLTVEKI